MIDQGEEKVEKKAALLLGPTACGKTALAVKLARAFDGEIVGADSRQVYKGLDVGSGKDLEEFSAGGEPVPYHMIDIAEPGVRYTLAEYLRDASDALLDVSSRGRLPLLVGGSALHIDALLKGYALPGGPPDDSLRESLSGKDVESLAKMLSEVSAAPPEGHGEDSNRSRLLRKLELAKTRVEGSGAPAKRFEAEWLALGVRVDRKLMHERIEKRLDARLASGMLDEARRLHESGIPWERLEWFGLEYRYMALHLQGKLGLREMRDALLAKIRQFAKRQDSWFRKMEREGLAIHWVAPDELEKASGLLKLFLAGEPIPPPEFRLMDVKFGPAS